MNNSLKGHGLTTTDLEAIRSALAMVPGISRAVLFGSRALGRQKPGSDVDIALYGPGINFDSVAKLNWLLNEEGSLPYRFDVVDAEHLKHRELADHIQRVGVTLWPVE